MKLNILYKIIEWQKIYQPNLTQEEGERLYNSLCEEEYEERKKALQEKNLVEYLDGIGDCIWVNTLNFYFNGSYVWNINNYFLQIDSQFFDNVQSDSLNTRHILDDILEEIIKSNFSKSFELQTEGEKIGKVIKGPNFVKPDLEKIINKYNLKWK